MHLGSATEVVDKSKIREDGPMLFNGLVQMALLARRHYGVPYRDVVASGNLRRGSL